MKSKLKLPPKPTHKCVDETSGKIIGHDLLTGKPIHEGKWKRDESLKWRAGDLFFFYRYPTQILRVHRVKGTTIYYLGNHYGHNPPRGIIRTAHLEEMHGAAKVERNYAMPRNATTWEFTNYGARSRTRSVCEKCNTPTNWVVMVSGRPAHWCGCGDTL